MTAALFLLFSYITVSHVEMREKPTNDSEIVSEAYFSEQVNVIEERGDWTKIETAVDKYQGWVQNGTYCVRKDEYLKDASTTIAKVNRQVAHLYDIEDTVLGPILDLPFESRLEVVDHSNSRWARVRLPDGGYGYIQKGCITFDLAPSTRQEMLKLCKQFLDTDYIWGGRSAFGYDCSGFVQMLYRQMGIHLPRDSKDQIKWEGFQSCLKEALEPGDAVFFGLDQDKIRHVGLYIGENQFIHSTVAENKPWIRISNLSETEWNGEGRYKYIAFRKLKLILS